MKEDDEFQNELSAAKFRDQFFLNAYATQNPRLYHELFDEPDVPEDFEIPKTPEDLQGMINELMAIGVNLNIDPDEVVPTPSTRQFDVRPAKNPWNA